MAASNLRTLPPRDDRAERAVLGSMLIAPAEIALAEETLLPGDFYLLRHQRIFATLCAMFQRGEAVDVLTLSSALGDQLVEVGGIEYLQELFDVIPTAANLASYAARVKDAATRRRYLDAAHAIAARVFDTEIETPDLAAEAEKRIFEIGQTVATRPYYQMREVVGEAYKAIEAMHESAAPMIGLPSGLLELDRLLSGFQASDLIILAARPSVGKTALSLTIARNAAFAQDKAILMFSLEMSRVQLALRLISSESRVNLQALRAGRFRDASWETVTAACSALSTARIVLDDAPHTTLREMRSKARRVLSEQGLALVIVDYLQLMDGRALGQRTENRQHEVAGLSRALKQLARELNVPVLALSQLSRKLEDRVDKRPILSDLRDSGAIEQDADVVLFLHREGRYEGKNTGPAEIIVAKQRNGPIGSARAFFRADTGEFKNLDLDHDEARYGQQ